MAAGQENYLVRVALLSLLEQTGLEHAGPEHPGLEHAGARGMPRGYLRIGGQSLARHQLALVLALGCTRVVFLADSLSGELVSLQHIAEERGAQFHVVSSPRALVGLVAPEDELVVLGDGLLALPDQAIALLGQGPGVLVLPVETGLAAGFERIDINHAEAGAMRLPGRLVAALGDLPGDWSTHSALLRLAMQGGVRQVPLSLAMIESGRWALIRSEAEAHLLEPRWLRLHTAARHRRSPGEALGAALVHWIGPAVLHAGTGPKMIAAGASVLVLLGLGAAWLGSATTGFALFTLAWLVRQSASLLARIERDSMMVPVGWFRPEDVFSWCLDLAFVAVAGWRSTIPAGGGVPPGMAWFTPLVLFAVLRLLPQAMPQAGWTHWLTDRMIAGLALTFASAFTVFDSVVMGSVALLLAGGLIFPGIVRPVAPNPVLTKDD